MRTRLAQLDPEAATEGQVPVYNSTSGEFEPADLPKQCSMGATLRTAVNPYIMEKSDTYVLVGDLPFGGTDNVGTPTQAVAVAWATSGYDTYVRIYDVTNAQQICEGSTSSTTKVVVDLGTLSNLSTGPAVWEIQIRSTANQNAFISAVGVC